MHFTSSLLGGVALLSFVSAVPLEKKAIGYGDRSEYAAAYAASSGGPISILPVSQTLPGQQLSTVYPNSPAPTNNYGGAPAPAYSGPSGVPAPDATYYGGS